MEDKRMDPNEVTEIYLCDCGSYRHRLGSKFCSRCGETIDPQRSSALAAEIEQLLERWEKEHGRIKVVRSRLFRSS